MAAIQSMLLLLKLLTITNEQFNQRSIYSLQVFDIGKGEHCPITGIEFHKVPNTSRYIVLVSTVNRFYKFHENLRVDEKPPYLQVGIERYQCE